MEKGQAVTSESGEPVERSVAQKAETGSNPLAAEFECSICYDLLLDPVVGNCGHDFCKHCYEKWSRISKKASCPICRKPLPRDLGVCVRLKNTIENLFPQRVRERQRQMEATLAEECAKKPRTGPLSLSDVLANQIPGIPITFESTATFERPTGMVPSEGQHLRVQPVDDIAPHVTLFFERLPAPPLRHYTAIGSAGTAVPAGLVPVQVGRPSTPPTLPQLPLGPPVPPVSPTTQGEVQGIGIPAIPAVPAAAAVLSVPAAITLPPWASAISRSSPISFRPAVPSALQHLLTPALVLSPTPTPISPAMGQVAPAHWGAPLEVFTVGMYPRDSQSRRRFLRRRVRAQNV